jgi:hypothetical protein
MELKALPSVYTPAKRARDIAALALLSLVALFGAARTGLIPRDIGNGVAVVYAPWVGAGRAVTRATAQGSRFVRLGEFSSIVVVMPDDESFTDRALGDGALLVLDPKMLAACGVLFSPKAKSS